MKKKKKRVPLSLISGVFLLATLGYTLAFRGQMHQPDLFQRSGIIFHSVDQLCEIWFFSVFTVRAIKYFTLTDLTFAGKH